MIKFITESILPLIEWDCPACKEIVITRFFISRVQQIIKCPVCHKGQVLITNKSKVKRRNKKDECK